MEQKGLRTGHIVAILGALTALASLWRPWYTVDVPQRLRDAISAQGDQVPALRGFAQTLAAALPSRISASGWQELQGADIALCVGMLAVVALVVGAAGAFGAAIRVEPRAAGQAIAVVGAAGVALVVVHLVHRPGGQAAADFVKLGSGAWIALAGSVATLAGGLMAAGAGTARRVPAASGSLSPGSFGPLTPALPPVFDTPAPGRVTSSVPPPAS
jgi:hypothetical protein